MSATGDLLDGLATDLNTAGIGVYLTTVGAFYAPTDTAITKTFMPDDPDRCITLTAYKAGGDSPNQPLGQINVQSRVRGLPDNADDAVNLDDVVYQLFQGMTDRTYGTAHVIQMLHKSSIPAGQDLRNRFEISTNWTLDVNYPPSQYRNQ